MGVTGLHDPILAAAGDGHVSFVFSCQVCNSERVAGVIPVVVCLHLYNNNTHESYECRQVQGKDIDASAEAGAAASTSVKEQHMQWQQQQQRQQQQQQPQQLSLAQPKKRLGPMRPRLPLSS